MWEKSGIEVEFTVLKHLLNSVKSKFDADVYYHIGDTELDKHYAERSGFQFLQVQDMQPEAWMLGPDGQSRLGAGGQSANRPQQPAQTTHPI